MLKKKVIGSTSLTYSLLFENIEQSAINDANDGLIVCENKQYR